VQDLIEHSLCSDVNFEKRFAKHEWKRCPADAPSPARRATLAAGRARREHSEWLSIPICGMQATTFCLYDMDLNLLPAPSSPQPTMADITCMTPLQP
jgi:hypothetical protein